MGRFDLYDHPRLYDILFDTGSAATVRGLMRVARDWTDARETPRWLEPACGTGRLLVAAARRGIRVTGYDRNPEMAAWARRRLAPFVRAAEVFVGDLVDADRRLRRRRFDFAFLLDNSLRHLPADAAVQRHRAGMARLVTPGGAYVIGLSFHDPARADVSACRGPSVSVLRST